MSWLSRCLRRRGQDHDVRRATAPRLLASVERLEDRVVLSGALASFPSPGAIGSIVNGPDGNVWFTEFAYISGSTTVDRITPDGRISDFAALPANSLTTGPDGNVWYAGSRILDEATNTSEGVVAISALQET